MRRAKDLASGLRVEVREASGLRVEVCGVSKVRVEVCEAGALSVGVGTVSRSIQYVSGEWVGSSESSSQSLSQTSESHDSMGILGVGLE